jgi:hypothetical protein
VKQALKKLTNLGKSKIQPRPAQEINSEFSQLCSKIGQARYTIHRLDSDIRSYISKIEDLDREMAERTKLDKETAESQPATPPLEPSGAV